MLGSIVWLVALSMHVAASAPHGRLDASGGRGMQRIQQCTVPLAQSSACGSRLPPPAQPAGKSGSAVPLPAASARPTKPSRRRLDAETTVYMDVLRKEVYMEMVDWDHVRRAYLYDKLACPRVAIGWVECPPMHQRAWTRRQAKRVPRPTAPRAEPTWLPRLLAASRHAV